MKITIPIFAFIILFAIANFAQTPTPPLLEDNDDVVKISTNLIQVDVTVTDKKDNAVKDLKPEDFEIYENGKKQEITNFSFVSAEQSQPQTSKENSVEDKNTISIPPSRIKSEQVRRTIALVVDDITLSFQSTYYVRRALRRFVDEQMQPGDLVAIIRTGGGIGALQQFTSDKRMLFAAIEKIRWQAYRAGGAGAFSPIEPTPLEQARTNGNRVSDEALEAEKNSIEERNNFREDIFATGTLGAINYIIRGMKDLPGRKSIMLMSDGFQLFSKTRDGFISSTRVLDSLKRLVDLANRSSVIVYTMDARGLQILGVTPQDNFIGLTAQDVEQRLSDRRDKSFNTQEGLVYLAKQTGGVAFVNSNDLNLGIRKMLDDQSYYLIGYQPDDETFDPSQRRFNKIKIKVKRDDVNVRYRSGFFGIDDEEIEKPKNLTPYQQITTALTSPFSVNDINLSLNTVFRSDASNNYYISSFLYISIKDLTFTDEPDGTKKAVFDLLAMSFGDNGNPVDNISNTYTVNIKAEDYQKLLKEGFAYNFTFPIKKAGAYQMRVAIRDHSTEKVGSSNQFIEVPKLNKKRLTLSGIVVQNLSQELWDKGKSASVSDNLKAPDPLADTAFRIFKRGTVLSYGFEIYNAKTEGNLNPKLKMQTKLFYNGKVILEGRVKDVDLNGQNDMRAINAAGAIALGTNMQSGDYVLQIVVTDEQAKDKYKIATQYVQFEIID